MYRPADVRESFIIHQVFYSLFALVWQNSSVQISNSLAQAIAVFIGVTMITDAFSHNTNFLQ